MTQEKILVARLQRQRVLACFVQHCNHSRRLKNPVLVFKSYLRKRKEDENHCTDNLHCVSFVFALFLVWSQKEQHSICHFRSIVTLMLML